MKIPNEMICNQVQHRYGGNLWAVVDSNEGEWMDIVSVSQANISTQFFRVWSKCLAMEKLTKNEGTQEKPKWVKTDENIPIHHTLMDKVKDIRDKLASGKWKIKDTRLVKA